MSDQHHHHHERHATSSASLRDFVLGMSDGLTVPFALAAGLAGAVDSSTLIVTAGIAEIAAGAISMGLGGYLAVKTEHDHYSSEERREYREVELVPHIEEKEVADIFRGFGIPEPHVEAAVNSIKQNPKVWVDFMMKFELGLEKPDKDRLFISPLIIGGAYALGGLVPLIPYMLIKHVPQAFYVSCLLSVIALLAFGAFKGKATGQNPWIGAFQTALIGGLAAFCAYMLARAVS